MWRAGMQESDHNVMAVARTQWFVYVFERLAPREISLMIFESRRLTPSGLFTYHTASENRNFASDLGFWKKASCSGFSLLAYSWKHENASPSWPMLYRRVCLSSQVFSLNPPWWFFVSSSWDIVMKLFPSASLANLKLSRRSERWPSLPRRHQ